VYRLRMGLCLLLGTTLLAGCSDRNALTAPSARPLASTSALVDRPYTWSFKCNGHWTIIAQWYWTENGLAIASGSASCSAGETLSGTGVRPANANGFAANVGDNSKSWSFAPAGPFNASLSGSSGGSTRHCFICTPKENGQLSVDS